MCDLLVGIVIHHILLTTILPSLSTPKVENTSQKDKDATRSSLIEDLERKATLYSSLYLLNPIIFSISTRGSSESILSLLVVSTLSLCLKQKWDSAAIMLGLATHWKIYPFIYASSIVSLLSWSLTKNLFSLKQSWTRKAWALFTSVWNAKTVRFALISGGFFALLNVVMYLV